ncbi:hypothetical protein B296_00052623, partial [Ensete ventricosum]
SAARYVLVCTGVSTHDTLVSTGVSKRKKEGRRRMAEEGGRKSEEEEVTEEEEKEEEKRPYLRRGGEVRLQQAEVAIDRSEGDAREPC